MQRQNFGGYRANIVTYTLALLSNSTSQRIDLHRIWREQSLTQDLQEVIAELSHGIHRIITNPPSARKHHRMVQGRKVLGDCSKLSFACPSGPNWR